VPIFLASSFAFIAPIQLGVGGLSLQAGVFSLEGIGLCGLAGVLLNLLLPQPLDARDLAEVDVEP
jgi:uracil permease